MSRKKVLRGIDFHEALDRAAIIEDNLCRHLLEHPAVKKTPRALSKITRAAELIAGAYQDLGRKRFQYED